MLEDVGSDVTANASCALDDGGSVEHGETVCLGRRENICNDGGLEVSDVVCGDLYSVDLRLGEVELTKQFGGPLQEGVGVRALLANEGSETAIGVRCGFTVVDSNGSTVWEAESIRAGDAGEIESTLVDDAQVFIDDGPSVGEDRTLTIVCSADNEDPDAAKYGNVSRIAFTY